MDANKLKESIRIAGEIAQEICTKETSTSPFVNKWKEDSSELYKDLRQQKNLAEEIRFRNSIELEKPMRNIHQRICPSTPRKWSVRTLSIAASLLLILGIVAILLWQKAEKEAIQWASAMPGKENPSITTDDNRTVKLEQSYLSVVSNQLIARTNDGKKKISIQLKQGPEFNRLIVPAGAEQQLTLADGTIVQINAASELLFPAHFEGPSRQVLLKGEACFNVKKDKEKPFIVRLGTLQVKVVGTLFNAKAYEEENEISIALLEGRVDIYKDGNRIAELLPQQLFTFRKDDSQYEVEETDLSAITDWTNGEFIFYDESIENIMQKLSRWYNVNITVDEKIKDTRYTGRLSRKQPLVNTLDALRLTNELEFDIQPDKKLEIQKKKN